MSLKFDTKFSIIFLCTLFVYMPLCAQTRLKLDIENKSKNTILDYLVEIPVGELNLKIGNYKITSAGKDVSPIELVTDIKGNQKAVALIPAIAPNQKLIFTIERGEMDSYPKRTSAELSHKIGGQFVGRKYEGGYSWVKIPSITLPGTFEDHSYFIKYEGPGWESDKVAFRFYLDNRNAIDVFGKKTEGIVLPGVGIDGFDNYHKMADWGMDNMKVGKSLGIGSIASWNGNTAVRIEQKDSTTCSITADGKLRSQIKTTYHGWKTGDRKIDLISMITIDAGNRGSHIELLASEAMDNLATGIIKQNTAKLSVRNQIGEEWSYIATFGKQSLNDDMQGLAVFVRTKDIVRITEDKLNHVVVLKTNKQGYVDYHIMATWEQDKEPVKTEADFARCIDQYLAKLNGNIKYSTK